LQVLEQVRLPASLNPILLKKKRLQEEKRIPKEKMIILHLYKWFFQLIGWKRMQEYCEELLNKKC